MEPTSETSIDLHDAILERIELVWEQKLCRCFVQPAYKLEPQSVSLEFSEVSAVSIPHLESWGPSSSILEWTQMERGYAITMQSGDVITITAQGCSIVTL